MYFYVDRANLYRSYLRYTLLQGLPIKVKQIPARVESRKRLTLE
jgi:hypothetical protein